MNMINGKVAENDRMIVELLNMQEGDHGKS